MTATPPTGVDVSIISGCCTAIDDFGGSAAAELSAVVVRQSAGRTELPPASDDDVIPGCAGHVVPERAAALGSDLSVSVPGWTMNRICGQGLQVVVIGAGQEQGRWGCQMDCLSPRGASAAPTRAHPRRSQRDRPGTGCAPHPGRAARGGYGVTVSGGLR